MFFDVSMFQSNLSLFSFYFLWTPVSSSNTLSSFLPRELCTCCSLPLSRLPAASLSNQFLFVLVKCPHRIFCFSFIILESPSNNFLKKFLVPFSLTCKPHGSRTVPVPFSTVAQCLAQCLAHSRISINTCGKIR